MDHLDMQLLSGLADGYNSQAKTKLKFTFRSGEVNPIQLIMDANKEYSFANTDVAIGFMLGLRDALGLNTEKDNTDGK